MTLNKTNIIWLMIGALLTGSALLGLMDPGADLRWQSGYIGFALFSANFVLMGLLGQWLLKLYINSGKSSPSRGVTLGILLAFLTKIFLIGGVSYLALAVFGYDGIGYIVGALASLATIALSAMVLGGVPQRLLNL